MAKYCEECGNPVKAEDRFCDFCGAPIPDIENYTHKTEDKKAFSLFVCFSIVFCFSVVAVYALYSNNLIFCNGDETIQTEESVQKKEPLRKEITYEGKKCIVEYYEKPHVINGNTVMMEDSTKRIYDKQHHLLYECIMHYFPNKKYSDVVGVEKKYKVYGNKSRLIETNDYGNDKFTPNPKLLFPDELVLAYNKERPDFPLEHKEYYDNGQVKLERKYNGSKEGNRFNVTGYYPDGRKKMTYLSNSEESFDQEQKHNLRKYKEDGTIYLDHEVFDNLLTEHPTWHAIVQRTRTYPDGEIAESETYDVHLYFYPWAHKVSIIFFDRSHTEYVIDVSGMFDYYVDGFSYIVRTYRGKRYYTAQYIGNEIKLVSNDNIPFNAVDAKFCPKDIFLR